VAGECARGLAEEEAAGLALRNRSGTLRDPAGDTSAGFQTRRNPDDHHRRRSPRGEKSPPEMALGSGCIVGLVLIIGVANSGTHSTANATPDEKLAVALAGLLGDSNRNIPRISRAMVDTDGTVEVHWSINDNLTPSLIRDGARQDVVNIVAVVTQTIGVSKQLIIVGDFAVPDGYGHTLERPVVAATYSARTLAKIGPGGIRSDRILRVADSTEVDAAFQ